MNLKNCFSSLAGLSVYLVGIKGTGMAALAELIVKRGGTVTGSDTEEQFYTDEVLRSLGISYTEGFSEKNLAEDIDLLIHSAAYPADSHPEILTAQKRGIPVITYPEALGFISELTPSTAVAGVHGKTTTTALLGTLVKEMGLPVSVLVGSAVPSLGGGSVYAGGEEHFAAETCEYRRHFMHFKPEGIILTSVEPDHLDYYAGYEEIVRAFTEFVLKLPEGGECIYCADDSGARDTVERVRRTLADTGRSKRLRFVPYGTKASGDFGITGIVEEAGRTRFTLRGFGREFTVRIPGSHTVLNCTAALAAAVPLLPDPRKPDLEAAAEGFAAFRGSRRRSEILGEAGGVLFMDDYGHHPTAIASTLDGLRKFYPGKRLVVDFMSHTYSRTGGLFAEFAASFSAADLVVFHKIYGSAREKDSSGVTGKKLFEAARQHTAKAVYFHEVMDAAEYLKKELRAGDLFLTLGAGNNWIIGRHLYTEFRSTDGQQETAV